MDKATALEKIKKCLALSKSANEHEAAQALKHAQKLMAQFGLEDADIALADVGEQRVKSAQTLPSWHWDLIHLCGNAFGCDRWVHHDFSGGQVVFCGTHGRPELAAYAYEVLLRQLKAARREYMKTTLSRVRIAKNKTARANEFCRGWVSEVRSAVRAFAMSGEEKGLIQQYKATKYGKFSTAKLRDVKMARKLADDYWRGRDAGEGVRLDTPLGKTAELKRLGK
ncbi:DUF2786 domain-containing protein [Eikenella sp. S3360]|uniref:DUF2786 domain-containing protein n=1 Tax=Eikenella glucosivorans TaxID=2766967 RepID=A0ABS0NA58_9NEIS|nr:DUF2786 domain-containing protein [Eikenella glucosivorans]MBH5329139.1 DUF2786 domain-containing protein [Eikenella glucosivorans]